MPGKENHILYHAIGLMSGTSLDGLDIAFCKFRLQNGTWSYKLLKAKTYPYNPEWRHILSSAEQKPAEELARLHAAYGHFLGKKVNRFLNEFKIKKNGKGIFVGSHGHTIFHQPEKKFTFQLGSGAAIAAECGLPVTCDFRTLDVALGGQGAPLVPIGDKLLFPGFDYCLNIGGIVNISLLNPGAETQKDTVGKAEKTGPAKRRFLAFDICPANIIFNNLANKLGKDFDRDGRIARSGKVSDPLLNELNSLDFYTLPPPKSLGKEWILKNFFPVLDRHTISIEDKMRTVAEHTGLQIAAQINRQAKTEKRKLLVTGGGAQNKFLISRIKSLCKAEVIIPDKQTINFKEALVFAFLGVLRNRKETNCLSSVTGARKDNCGGAVYLP